MIRNLPFYLFMATAFLNVLLINFDLPVWVYEKVFVFVNEWIGNSVLFNIYMAFHLKKIDSVNRISLLGLFAFNAVNIIFMSVPMGFDLFKMLTIYAIILTVAGLVVIWPLIKKLWLIVLKK